MQLFGTDTLISKTFFALSGSLRGFFHVSTTREPPRLLAAFHTPAQLGTFRVRRSAGINLDWLER